MSNNSAIIEAFSECLDDLLDGRPLSDCLKRHAHLRDRLEPLLAVVAAARKANYVPTWTHENRSQARAVFLKHVASVTQDVVQADGTDSDNPRE